MDDGRKYKEEKFTRQMKQEWKKVTEKKRKIKESKEIKGMEKDLGRWKKEYNEKKWQWMKERKRKEKGWKRRKNIN